MAGIAMYKLILLGATSILLSSCASMDMTAVRSTARVLERGRATILDEPDWQLARESAASQIKLVESLIASDPGNITLRRLAAEGLSGYAFLFVEDEDPLRAKALYLRARDHALAALACQSGFKSLSTATIENFENNLMRASRNDVPDLFWAGFSWGGMINLSKNDAAAIAELPKAFALMKRVYELDPAFQHGGADLFFGVYYASRPKILGGDVKKSKAHFSWAQRINNGQYLMGDLLEARWLAVANQDKDQFVQLLNTVIKSAPGRLPESRLADEMAKQKAQKLLRRTDEFF